MMPVRSDSEKIALDLCAEMYSSYCQDFGPTNIALVIRFIRYDTHPRAISLLPCLLRDSCCLFA